MGIVSTPTKRIDTTKGKHRQGGLRESKPGVEKNNKVHNDENLHGQQLGHHSAKREGNVYSYGCAQ